jgi:hypothetical protein
MHAVMAKNMCSTDPRHFVPDFEARGGFGVLADPSPTF